MNALLSKNDSHHDDEPRKPLRVLIVEDSPDDADLIVLELKRQGYEPLCERVETSDTMREALTRQAWDVVVVDYTMPQFSAPAALKLLQQLRLDIPFILTSGTITEEVASQMMASGADDYVMKNDLSRLVPVIERELGISKSGSIT